MIGVHVVQHRRRGDDVVDDRHRQVDTGAPTLADAIHALAKGSDDRIGGAHVACQTNAFAALVMAIGRPRWSAWA